MRLSELAGGDQSAGLGVTVCRLHARQRTTPDPSARQARPRVALLLCPERRALLRNAEAGPFEDLDACEFLCPEHRALWRTPCRGKGPLTWEYTRRCADRGGRWVARGRGKGGCCDTRSHELSGLAGKVR